MSARVALAFTLCSLLWGSTFLAIRIGNETIAPLWAAAIRLAIAAPALTLIAAATRAHWPRGTALRTAILFGVFQIGVNFSLLYWGQQTVPSGVASVLYATAPLFTALLAATLRLERLSIGSLAAAVLGLIGVVIIFAGELSLAIPLSGLLAILAGSVSGSISAVLLKQGPLQDLVPLNAVAAAVGLPFCLASSVLLGEVRSLPATGQGWLSILYLVGAGSLGGYLLFAWLVKNWTVTKASYLGLTIPIVAVSLGALVAQERPSALTGAGIALVTAAVLVRLGREAPAD